MKLFRRKSSAASNVPPEVAEYYQAERRGRGPMAWVMTLFALLVTVIIVLGLFLAGRWLYRTVRGDDAPSQQTAQNQPNTQTPQTSDSQSSDNQNNSANREPDTTNNDQGAGTGEQEPGEAPAERREPSTPRPDTETDQPSAGAGTTDDELTNTGPGETAAALFVLAAVVGYVVQLRRFARR